MTLPGGYPGVFGGDGPALMSDGELTRLEVLRDLDRGRLTTEAAAQLLRLKGRQIYRLLKAYRTDGATGLVSKRRGAAVLGAGWIEYIIMQLPYSHCTVVGIGTRERVRDCDLRSCRCLISTR
jgi:hypothetical protein